MAGHWILPDREPRPLNNPITADELATAFSCLNNGRACGPDEIPAELLKYSSDILAQPLAAIINRSFETGKPIELSEGTLIALPKPNKPPGECASLRPIVLLNSIRKAISIVTLKRISPAVQKFLSPHQSGFRANRSTADAVWAHRWIAARAQRFRIETHILGIDLTRAFDTINRELLLQVLEDDDNPFSDDDVRLVRLLLTNTTLAVRSSNHTSAPFASNTGTPQGDSLSPVLFIVYLEAVLRDLASETDLPRDLLEQMIVYADDADFICPDPATLEIIQARAPAVFAKWSLTMNSSKTEITKIIRCLTPSGQSRHRRAVEEQWRETIKLGSALGDSEDVSRRKSLATVALRKLWSTWQRPTVLSIRTRVRLYNCYVLPVLLYNCGTWALTTTQLTGLESFHRRQLRQVLAIRFPNHVSNLRVYELCGERPLRHRVADARWRLFGHILRRPANIPAYIHMDAYFSPTAAPTWRGRPRTTLPLILDHDLVNSGLQLRLRTANDLEKLRAPAQDRKKWQRLKSSVLDGIPSSGDPTYADTTLCRGLATLSLARA